MFKNIRIIVKNVLWPSIFLNAAENVDDNESSRFWDLLILSPILHCSGVWFWLRPGPIYFPAQTRHVHNSPLRNFRKNIRWYTLLLLMTLITIILVKYLINVFSFYFLHTHIKYHIWYTICLRSHPCPGYCIFCHYSICKIG